MEYPKIDTLFERNEKFVVDPTKLKKSVLGTIREWDVTEKVDGTNIRVMFTPAHTEYVNGAYGSDGALAPKHASVAFNGRTDNAQMPGDLVQTLIKMFPVEKFTDLFQTPVILYGEGYGAGIQKVGRFYRPDKSFILFDVLIDGKWWLDTNQVADVGKQLGIEVVPYLGRMTLDEIVEYVRVGQTSVFAQSDMEMEGIVARPIETLFDKRHGRVIIKLKTKDFKEGKR